MSHRSEEEYAEYLHDCRRDELAEQHRCLGCEGPLPPAPAAKSYSRPARCPKCRPEYWIEYQAELPPEFRIYVRKEKI